MIDIIITSLWLLIGILGEFYAVYKEDVDYSLPGFFYAALLGPFAWAAYFLVIRKWK